MPGLKKIGYIKVAAIVPPLMVADTEYNAGKIIEFSKKAEADGALLIVFPELSTTGYTSADLFFQRTLLENNLSAIDKIKTASKTAYNKHTIF